MSNTLIIEAPKNKKYSYAHGKRKSAVAKVRMYKGEGKITINNKAIDEYISVKDLIAVAKKPLKLVGAQKAFDITIKVVGGGNTAQAEAIAHGIAKVLAAQDEANKITLKKAGFLTRDDRTKERRKYGLKKARKAPQFSKR
jgi:small subunit ribosomal protein S9